MEWCLRDSCSYKEKAYGHLNKDDADKDGKKTEPKDMREQICYDLVDIKRSYL